MIIDDHHFHHVIQPTGSYPHHILTLWESNIGFLSANFWLWTPERAMFDDTGGKKNYFFTFRDSEVALEVTKKIMCSLDNFNHGQVYCNHMLQKIWLVYSSMYRNKKRYCICLGTQKPVFPIVWG